MRRTQSLCLVVSLFFFPHQASAVVQKKPTQATTAKKTVDVNKLADAIQKQYNSIKTATFDFEQTYKHPYLALETSKGHVSYDKTTGNMVWDYREPKEKQKKFFISGKKLTYYSVSDNIVYINECYDKALSASITFLLGTGSLKNSFSVSALETAPPNAALSWLALTPKEKNTPVSKLLLGVDQKSKVKESVVIDPSGGENHFKFIETYEKINKNTFTFVPPPGVHTQPMPNVVCPPTPPLKKPMVEKKPTTKPAQKKANTPVSVPKTPSTPSAPKVPKKPSMPEK